MLPCRAAILLDFENIYFTFRRGVSGNFDVLGGITSLLRNLRERSETELNCKPLVRRAYADFDRIDDDAERALFLNGFEPVFALGTSLSAEHKNAADMKLCVDAITILYTREDISTFIIAAGDRDYIPVINHLIQAGKSVIVVSFKAALSGDLRQIVGHESIWEADELLPESAKEAMDEIRRLQLLDQKSEHIRRQQEERSRAEMASTAVRAEPIQYEEPTFEAVEEIDIDRAHDALEVIIAEYSHHAEIWLRPVLYRLEREFPFLANFEVKDIIQELVNCGAIAIVQREGDGKTYSIIKLNYNHPDVRELIPG